MLDPTSRYTIVTRLQDERRDEARRAHVLRAAREEEQERAALSPVVAPSVGIRSTVAGVVHAVRHAASPARHQPAH